MAESIPRILLAEDDHHLGLLLREYLQSEGFDVMLCTTGQSALEAIQASAFDIYLFDVMLPVVDGFTLARRLREKDSQVPVIFITARSMREDKQTGYTLGADDYITKPFDEEELLWKIRALLRRNTSQTEHAQISIGNYVFDPGNQSLHLGDQKRRITEKEAAILQYLATHRNKVIRREVMVQELWGQNDYFLGRSLDVFISRLRKYFEADPNIKITNLHGIGFRFSVNQEN